MITFDRAGPTQLTPIGFNKFKDYLPLAGGTMTGDITLGANLLKYTNVAIKEDGATVIGMYDAAGLNYRSVALDDIQPIGSLQFQVDAEEISAPDADDDYTIIKARDNGVGLTEVARISGAADPTFSFGGAQQNVFFESGAVHLGGFTTLASGCKISDTKGIQTGGADDDYFFIKARDNGVGYIIICQVVSAADPYVEFGNSGNAIKAYYSGALEIKGQAVSFGAADSGGAGFRQVLVPN